MQPTRKVASPRSAVGPSEHGRGARGRDDGLGWTAILFLYGGIVVLAVAVLALAWGAAWMVTGTPY